MSFRVANVQEYFRRLNERFSPGGADGVDAVFQFELDGDGGGVWHAVVCGGQMQLRRGTHESPTTTIRMNAAEYVEMTNGDLNGQNAYMTGRLQIGGSIPMAMRMRAIFPAA